MLFGINFIKGHFNVPSMNGDLGVLFYCFMTYKFCYINITILRVSCGKLIKKKAYILAQVGTNSVPLGNSDVSTDVREVCHIFVMVWYML